MKDLLKEFKPTIYFLLKFIGIYVAGSLLYGWYITNSYPEVDGATRWVTEQTAFFLSLIGWDSTTALDVAKPHVLIVYNLRNMIAVYEGCNGINVIIIFLAFIIAFGPMRKELFWFIPLGLLIIHVSNLLRLILLFMVTLYFPHSLYFAHKYLFTAFIFLVVFALWLWWVRKFKTRGK